MRKARRLSFISALLTGISHFKVFLAIHGALLLCQPKTDPLLAIKETPSLASSIRPGHNHLLAPAASLNQRTSGTANDAANPSKATMTARASSTTPAARKTTDRLSPAPPPKESHAARQRNLLNLRSHLFLGDHPPLRSYRAFHLGLLLLSHSGVSFLRSLPTPISKLLFSLLTIGSPAPSSLV